MKRGKKYRNHDSSNFKISEIGMHPTVIIGSVLSFIKEKWPAQSLMALLDLKKDHKLKKNNKLNS